MSTFDDLVQEARDAGVDEAWLTRFQSASAASPLRQERDALKEQLAQVTERANTYRTASLAAAFEKVGATGNPAFLQKAIPEDIDPLDTDKVREWAVNAGLAAAPPPAVTPEEQAAHQGFAQAAAGASSPQPVDARNEILNASSEEEFWSKAQAAGVTT